MGSGPAQRAVCWAECTEMGGSGGPTVTPPLAAGLPGADSPVWGYSRLPLFGGAWRRCELLLRN